jgi:hypothetical protein
MTNNEDFFAMAYSGLVLSGLLISIVPAFIASKRNKSFWIWWLVSSFLFTICSTVLIKAQLFSLLLYLLAIVPVVSILALLPSPRPKKTLSHIFSDWTASQSGRLYDVYWCLFTLVLAGILYYYLLPHKWDHGRYGDESYSLILALVFVTACLGYLLFILFLSEKSKRDVYQGFLLTFLLSIPILLNPSRAFSVLEIRNSIAPEVDLGSVIAALIAKPIGGIFILFGLCSVPAAFLIVLNEKYRVANLVVTLFRSHDYSPPNVHFSRMSAAPILVFCILYIIFFKVFFHPNEGWIFLIPLVWLCFGLPTFLFAITGILLSSIVIGISINQKKNLYAFGIFLCGLLAIWEGVPTPFSPGLPVSLLVSYGTGSGLIALVLWFISDLSGSRQVENI